jgi:hypothetical protein
MDVTRFKTTALTALATGLLIVLAGCGDDDSTSSEDSAKADFIAEGDQICTQTGVDVSEEAQKRFPSGVAPADGGAIEKFFAEVTIPALRDQYEQIGALTPPSGDEDEVQAILDAGNEAVDEAEKDPRALAVLKGGKTPFDEVSQLEQAYGFQVCGAADPDAS